MLSLKSVLFVLMLFVAAIVSTWAWYQWSPQVIQLKVPVGGAVGVGAAVGPTLAPLVGAAVGAGVAAVEHAAATPPSPMTALAAPVTLRNWRRLYSRIRSVIPRSFDRVPAGSTQFSINAASSAGHH